MGRIKEFLEIQRSRKTKKCYRSALVEFLDFIYGKTRKGKRVRKEEIEKYERLAERYFSESRDYFKDLLNFAIYLSEKAPRTSYMYIMIVKQFLEYNNVVFTPKQLKIIKQKLPKSAKPITKDEELDKEMIRRILEYADIRLRAIILVLASSGMRIGELLQIRLSDLDLSKDPPEITIRGSYTKSDETRTVFISQEAKKTLEEWLNIRDKYLERAKGRAKVFGGKKEEDNDDRLFPFRYVLIEEAFINAVKKAGLFEKDPITGRATIHLHSFRKFFRSAMLDVGMPLDIAEALMGHSGYLTEAYRRYTHKQIADWYKKCEHAVTIYGSPEAEMLKRKLKEKEEELRRKEEELQQRFKEMQQQLMSEIEMKLRQESIIHRATVEGLVKDKIELEEKIKKLERQIEELRSYLILLAKGKVDRTVPHARTDEDIFERIKSEMPEFVTEE